MRRRAPLASLAVLLLIAVSVWRWGAWTYVTGVARSLRDPSPNEHRHEDILLNAEHPAGSALVLHGMNFDAEGMRSLGEVFRDLGYRTLVPRLAGHRGVPEETLTDLSPAWRRQAEEWGRELSPPLICAGYSLGALVLLEAQLAGRLHCHRFVVFSPALAAHVPLWMIRLLKPIWPKRGRVPSAIPAPYRHFVWTGMGTTFSFFEILENFHALAADPSARRLVPPGLMVYDARDEVVNAGEAARVAGESFANWKFMAVEAADLPERHAHHLLVDERHVGADQWRAITAAIKSLLD